VYFLKYRAKSNDTKHKHHQEEILIVLEDGIKHTAKGETKFLEQVI